MTRQQIKSQAARYSKFVEWSDEDQCFIGRCPGLFDGGVHGADEAKVYKELCEAVEEWIELLHKDGAPLPKATSGKAYSGKFVLRVDAALHRRLALKAQAIGESLNNYCVKALTKA
jgi:predicted HicB family RNase H-like nuclease